jgi:hypothetical protein
MKKWILAPIFMLAMTATPARADFITINLDFSGVTTTQDITLPNSLNLGGVTLQYDPQGSDTTASVDTSGVFGFGSVFLGGVLNLIFDSPALGLGFNYAVFGGSLNHVDAIFNAAGSFTDFASSDSGTFAYGTVAGQTVTPFDMVSLAFSDGLLFTMDSVRYDAPVPEPSALSLLACSIALLGWRLRRRKA